MKMLISEGYNMQFGLDTMIDVTPGYHHTIFYLPIETISWPWPYQTNCRSYRTKGEQSQSNHETLSSQNECIIDCVHSFVMSNNSSKCLPPYMMSYKEKYIESKKGKLILCDDSDSISICKLDSQCKAMIDMYFYCATVKCQEQCYKIQYEFHLKKELPESVSNYTLVTVMPKFGFYKKNSYEASVTLQKLFADLGGLGGLWIGFNVLSIYKSITRLFFKDNHNFILWS